MVHELRRLWCKKCQEWELFELHYPNWEEWFCKKCGEKFESILLSEIPEEKLIEQRKRFVDQESKTANQFLYSMMLTGGSMLHNMFSEPSIETHIIESDAGQHAIWEKKKKEREEKKRLFEEEKEKVKSELSIFRGIQRNDNCPCGSDKKYKKCCLEKVNSQLIKYNLRF